MKARKFNLREPIAYYWKAGSIFKIESNKLTYFDTGELSWATTWWTKGMVLDGTKLSKLEAEKKIKHIKKIEGEDS